MNIFTIKKHGKWYAAAKSIEEVAKKISMSYSRTRYIIMHNQTSKSGFSIVYRYKKVKNYLPVKTRYWTDEKEIEESLSPKYSAKDLKGEEREMYNEILKNDTRSI